MAGLNERLDEYDIARLVPFNLDQFEDSYRNSSHTKRKAQPPWANLIFKWKTRADGTTEALRQGSRNTYHEWYSRKNRGLNERISVWIWA
jgi:hypothetical protein